MFNDAFYNQAIEKKDDSYNLLKVDKLKDIDFKFLENNLLDLLDNIQDLQEKYEIVSIPRITPSYEIREEQFTNNTKSKIEDTAIIKDDIEHKLNYYIDAFTKICNVSFCYYEKTFFIDFYVKHIKKDAVITELGIYKDKYTIIKRSTLAKIGYAFGWIDIPIK